MACKTLFDRKLVGLRDLNYFAMGMFEGILSFDRSLSSWACGRHVGGVDAGTVVVAMLASSCIEDSLKIYLIIYAKLYE